MKIMYLIIVINVLFLFNCVSTGENIEKMQDTEYKSPDILNIDVEKIKTIDKWSLKFKYENITIETKELSDGSIEKTKKDFGYSKYELQFIDSLYYSLKYQYNLNIEKNVPAEGIIEISTLITQVDSNEIYYSIQIIFSDQDNILAINNYRKTAIISQTSDGYSTILKNCIDIILTRLNK